MDGIIYRATSKTTKKVYVGLTINSLQTRKTQHKCRSKQMKTHFYYAINKYGWDDFDWDILESGIEDFSLLKEREIYWINELDSYKNGYNITSGGEGILGFKFSDEQIKKRTFYGEKNPFFGKKHSEETKKKISLKNSGKNAPRYGIKMSDKEKEFLRNVHLGKKKSPEHIKKSVETRIREGSHLREKNGRARKVIIDGVLYLCIKTARETLGLSEMVMSYRLKSEKFENYQYV